MISYGLRNIRRLKRVSPIPLKPITLLLGKNSSGKSSYLRSLPLLQQSLSAMTDGAILWWGELVDFGSFSETLTKDKTAKAIAFDFEIDSMDVTLRQYRLGRLDILTGNSNSFIINGINYSSTIMTNENGSTYVVKLRIEFMGQELIINFSENHTVKSVRINGDPTDSFSHLYAITETYSIFPCFLYRKLPFDFDDMENEAENLVSFLANNWATYTSQIANLPEDSDAAAFAVLYKKMTEAGASIESDHDGDDYLSQCDDFAISQLVEFIGDAYISKLCLGQLAPTIVNVCGEFIKDFIRAVSYIGPARVRSERYYRKQDLSVLKISPDGTNFPMFLASLADHQLREFSALVNRLYGYSVRLAKEAGHVSILLGRGRIENNLIDAGYGLSQILPVIGQMWWLSQKDPVRRRIDQGSIAPIVAIEQPELHLHPAHQSTLADALADFAKTARNDNRLPITFLIETHSEALVQRFGSLIFEGLIPKDDVQIVIFNEDVKGSASHTTISTYDDDGALIDWPFGFFNAM